jgi:hypothetical protein
MKYRALYIDSSNHTEVIKVCNTKEEAIEACVEYKMGYFSCDTKQERRIGLRERGWSAIGYSSNLLEIEEVNT